MYSKLAVVIFGHYQRHNTLIIFAFKTWLGDGDGDRDVYACWMMFRRLRTFETCKVTGKNMLNVDSE